MKKLLNEEQERELIIKTGAALLIGAAFIVISDVVVGQRSVRILECLSLTGGLATMWITTMLTLEEDKANEWVRRMTDRRYSITAILGCSIVALMIYGASKLLLIMQSLSPNQQQPVQLVMDGYNWLLNVTVAYVFYVLYVILFVNIFIPIAMLIYKYYINKNTN